MKRILRFILFLLLVIVFVSCGENNEGPFETRKENGKLVLYSDNKLAKGWVEQIYTDSNSGITYKMSEIEYDKGLPTGKFKYYNGNGNLVFDADLKKKGDIYKGTVKIGVEQDNILKGEFNLNSDWIVINKDTRIFLTSYLVLVFSKEVLYNGSVDGPLLKLNKINGTLDGIYEEYHENGKLFKKGKYKNGKKDGRWEGYDENGQLRGKSNYKNGKLDGIGEAYDKNGQLDIRAEYKDGVFNGMYEGRGIKVKYKNGNYDGIYERYNNFKKLIERIEYSDGIKNGVYELYDDNGEKIIVKGNYKNDLKDGIWEDYDENGQLRTKSNYKNDLRDGIYEEYHENGKLFKKGKYKNGEKDGRWEGYDKNGQLRGESNYKNGKLDGIATLYNTDGSFDQEIEYKDGVQVK